MKFTIGRAESNDYQAKEASVSASHAEITISKDLKSFDLIDLDSTNGTFINGRRVVSKKITDKDVVRFGNHQLEGNQLFALLNSYLKKERVDFTHEFEELLKLEEGFKTKRRKITKYYRLLAMLPRLLITLVVVLIIFLIPNLGSDLRYPLMIGATLLGTMVSSLGISEQKKESKLDALKANFQLEFLCPKCDIELSMGNRDGSYYKNKKTCNNRKCNVTWLKTH